MIDINILKNKKIDINERWIKLDYFGNRFEINNQLEKRKLI